MNIYRSKSFVKYPLAWEGGFAVGGCEMQKKTQLLVFFLGLDMQEWGLAFGAR